MKRLCIIPARGGSKRLPRKNIKKLNGKPLIQHTIDATILSNVFDKIIFTSDDLELLNLVKNEYNVNNLIISKRPEELASDTSKVIDTVMYLLDETFDQTWLSLPTAPLKNANDFKKASKLLTKDVNSVISYTDMEFPPTLGLNEKDGFIYDYSSKKPWINGNSRSQDHPKVYRPNGAIYGAWNNILKETHNYYTLNTKGYYMPRERSIDIDTQFDFDLAEFTLNKNNIINE